MSKSGVIYGGAFNPPHLGHVFCISTLLTYFPNDQIVLVPNRQDVCKKDLIPFSHRLELLKCLVEETLPRESGDRLIFSAIESVLPGPSYTIKTLNAYKSMADSLKIERLAIGLDQWFNFNSWYLSQEIGKAVEIVVLLRDIKQSMGLDKMSLRDLPYKVKFIEIVGPNISSSELNRSQDESFWLRWVGPMTLEYMKKNNLFIYGRKYGQM